MKKLFFTALMMASLTSHAQFRTGNELLSDMKEPTGYKSGLAMGYIMGATEAGNGVFFCLPATVTAGQVSDMVRNRLTSSPAIRHHTADTIIYALLEVAWPCEKKGQKL